MATTPVQGAQVVGRVALLIRLVARYPGGSVLADIVRDSGLTRPTVHRLLTSLAQEGLLDHDKATNAWRLGPELYVMGTLAARSFPIEEYARPSLERLANDTGESAFLSVRRGTETACLLRQEGSFPVRSFVLHEGARFPLGVASAGLAIMAYLPENEIEELLRQDQYFVRKWGAGHSPEAIRDNLQKTRATGFAVNPGLILEGSWGMGAAIFDRNRWPVWALSLTGIEPRFRPERREFMGKLLLEEAHRVTQKLQQAPA